MPDLRYHPHNTYVEPVPPTPEMVGGWVYERISEAIADGTLVLVEDTASWEALHDVCDPNEFIDQASERFRRPTTAANLWFWNAVTDEVTRRLADRATRTSADRRFSWTGDAQWAGAGLVDGTVYGFGTLQPITFSGAQADWAILDELVGPAAPRIHQEAPNADEVEAAEPIPPEVIRSIVDRLYDALAENATSFNCDEAEAIADLFHLAGWSQSQTDTFIYMHSLEDDEGDDHYEMEIP